MKKYKNIVIQFLAVIGLVFLLSGFNSQANDEEEVGRYQIAVTNNGGRKVQLYRVDTKTGVIVNINERELEKIRSRNDNLEKQN